MCFFRCQLLSAVVCNDHQFGSGILNSTMSWVYIHLSNQNNAMQVIYTTHYSYLHQYIASLLTIHYLDIRPRLCYK